ncbi:hypothetical protein BGI37_11420 [Snodgrassella alvi]|nr:hypothetical protein BGI37_11420 [Snodgrassella alvi]
MKRNGSKKYASMQLQLARLYFEQEDYDKAEACDLNITKEDSLEFYAQAQFYLGHIYSEQEDFDKAVACYLNITKEDSLEFYAQAQFYLGHIYSEQEDFDKAVACYLNITKKDLPEFYPIAQFNLGQLYLKKGIYDKAEAYYLNITKEDSLESYAQAQINLGNIYFEQEDYDKAETCYLNITKENPSKIYAQAQFNLGLIYLKKGIYDKAEACYLNITKEDSLEFYAQAQINLGHIYSEQEDYDKAETCYLNITKEDSLEFYAQAQFNLGLIYLKKGIYDKAEACYLNITKENPSKIYAQAQFNLGLIYLKKGIYDKAEVYYLNITKEDSLEFYAQAQINLGLIYLKKGIYDKAEAYYLNITKEDSLKYYAQAQFNLGLLYLIQDVYDKAKAQFLNITKEDYPEVYTYYAYAQFYLGLIYEIKKLDCANAKFFYSNIKKKGSNPECYAYAQFCLGSIYLKDQNYKNAEDCFREVNYTGLTPEIYIFANLIIKIIENNFYFSSYKNESENLPSLIFDNTKDIYELTNKIKYKLSIHLINNNLQNNSKKINELEQNITGDATLNKNESNNLLDLTFIFNNIEAICRFAKDIKEKLLVSFKLADLSNNTESMKEPERRVAHYTKPAVLFNLLKGDNPSKFRLNIVDFMNDPSENQVLTNWLNITNNSDNEFKSFLASFTFNHNSLNQFRLYGNEDNIAGSGVSITFNQYFFGLDTERSISNEIALAGIRPIMSFDNKQIKLETEQTEIKSDDTLHPLPLYRCLYFDPKTEYMALAKRNKQSFYLEMCDEENETVDIDAKWQSYINNLNEERIIQTIRDQLKKIKESMKNLLENAELQKIPNLEQLLSLAVLPISCLIKHAAFEDEDECRMIYITHIGDEKIVEPQDYQSTTSLYVEYTHVENYIDNIYLGPNCKAQHELWLQNHIKKKQRGKQIRLIKSEVPLR